MTGLFFSLKVTTAYMIFGTRYTLPIFIPGMSPSPISA